MKRTFKCACDKNTCTLVTETNLDLGDPGCVYGRDPEWTLEPEPPKQCFFCEKEADPDHMLCLNCRRARVISKLTSKSAIRKHNERKGGKL